MGGFAHLVEAGEEIQVEHFLAERAIEALDEGILIWRGTWSVTWPPVRTADPWPGAAAPPMDRVLHRGRRTARLSPSTIR
ncbi:hypothetical protein [Xanthomonas sp. DAR33341]|uniref:hypothetical protein n=1 Tax=Xanthomonas sp. DAR33341 TaxID=2182387 RepID=UPI0019CF99C2|nr:hypothetical protein [Xanthomonas sp. DAR33341]